MLKKIRQFTALDVEQKSVFVRAWFLLGWMRAAMLMVSFQRLSASLHHHRQPVDSPTLHPRQLEQALSIGKLVAAAARCTPWQSRCLVQVLVVQRLLAKRNIPGQFYLGVRKEAEDGLEAERLAAHAWLQCGHCIVNGAVGHDQFAVLSSYSWDQTE
ncbi:MAG: lasso peptide biosynthesis B2 protein [Gammaproteobacteria bacterium]|nr:MAG: lasso peptide biosynthesis B2 protein [Gammaproteobacteria bacterium]RLA54972.1 MAG: lasso peptide biosynthesis B2 protein [Gammaproteobacteria bacterium]